MKRLKLTAHNREELAAIAVEFLQEGGVVLLPTDTAYALAAEATNQAAVEAVFTMKGRSPAQVSSIVVADKDMAERFGRFSPSAVRLWDAFLPGPLTLVVPVVEDVGLADSAMQQGQTVGLRYPEYQFASEVTERLGQPFTATSANLTGRPPAYDPDEFLNSLPAATNPPHLVIDAGILPMVPVSTVVEAAGDQVKILREGAIPEADIMGTI